MSELTNPELIAELRRQRGMRNATWPCVLLKDLMPLLDEFERLQQLASPQPAIAFFEKKKIACNEVYAGNDHPHDKHIQRIFTDRCDWAIKLLSAKCAGETYGK